MSSMCSLKACPQQRSNIALETLTKSNTVIFAELHRPAKRVRRYVCACVRCECGISNMVSPGIYFVLLLTSHKAFNGRNTCAVVHGGALQYLGQLS